MEFWDQKPGVWRPKLGDMSCQEIEMTHNSNMNALTKRAMDTWKNGSKHFFSKPSIKPGGVSNDPDMTLNVST